MYIFYKDIEHWFSINVAKGKDFLLNIEYYGYSLKMNGKIYKYNHKLNRI